MGLELNLKCICNVPSVVPMEPNRLRINYRIPFNSPGSAYSLPFIAQTARGDPPVEGRRRRMNTSWSLALSWGSWLHGVCDNKSGWRILAKPFPLKHRDKLGSDGVSLGSISRSLFKLPTLMFTNYVDKDSNGWKLKLEGGFSFSIFSCDISCMGID